MQRLLRSMIFGICGLASVAAIAPAASAAPTGKDGLSIKLNTRGLKISIGRPVCRPAPVRRVHVHHFRVAYHRIWVPAKYQAVVVGYDRCGNAIFNQVMVRAARYKQVRYQTCGCGARR